MDAATRSTLKKSPLTNRPSAYRAFPPCARLNTFALHAITPENDCCCVRKLSHCADVKFALRVDHQPDRLEPFTKSIYASSRGFPTGNGRSRMASISWKIAVFAPIPSASDSTATAVNV